MWSQVRGKASKFGRPWEDSLAFPPQPTGFQRNTGHHGAGFGASAPRPAAPAWMSDDLIAETRRVWSAAYGRVISGDEAIEILLNVRRIAEVFLNALAEEP